MSQLETDVASEGTAQLSFSFEPRAQGFNTTQITTTCKGHLGVVLSFPRERCSTGEQARQAQLLQRILNRSRFF